MYPSNDKAYRMAYIKEEFRVASWVNVLIAIWLLMAPFALGFTPLGSATWNSLSVGTVMLIVALFGLIKPLQKPGLMWINFVLGLWLIASPALLGFSHSLLPTLSHIAMGGIVAGLAAGAAIGSRWSQKPDR
jgi:predicted anti-sigma-YlaC factor YlaD